MTGIYERFSIDSLNAVINSQEFRSRIYEGGIAASSYGRESGFSVLKNTNGGRAYFTPVVTGGKHSIRCEKFEKAVRDSYFEATVDAVRAKGSATYEFLRLHFHTQGDLRPSEQDIRTCALTPGVASSKTEIAPLMAIAQCRKIHQQDSQIPSAVDILVYQRRERIDPRNIPEIVAHIDATYTKAYLERTFELGIKGLEELLGPSQSMNLLTHALAAREALRGTDLFDATIIRLDGSGYRTLENKMEGFAKREISTTRKFFDAYRFSF